MLPNYYKIYTFSSYQIILSHKLSLFYALQCLGFATRPEWRTVKRLIYPCFAVIFFFQAEDGIRDPLWSRGLGDVYKRQSQYAILDGLQNLNTVKHRTKTACETK